MIPEYLPFILGIILLIKGADWLIDGSTALAKKLGISSLIIGLTVVAFGTSLPELLVTVFSVIKESEEIVLGNIIGSNISNLLLILGLTALITPLVIRKNTIKIDIPFSLLAALVLLVTVISFTTTTKFIGLIFLILFSLYLYLRIKLIKKNNKIIFKKNKDWKIFLYILIGSVALYFGGKFTVEGIIPLSQKLGISEFLISATILAIGTSLPELVTSLRAVYKKNPDIAVGNIIGSNIFNIFWVLGIGALIKPIFLPKIILLDIFFLSFVTLLTFAFLYIGKTKKLTKIEGAVLLILYFMYISFIIFRG